MLEKLKNKSIRVFLEVSDEYWEKYENIYRESGFTNKYGVASIHLLMLVITMSIVLISFGINTLTMFIPRFNIVWYIVLSVILVVIVIASFELDFAHKILKSDELFDFLDESNDLDEEEYND